MNKNNQSNNFSYTDKFSEYKNKRKNLHSIQRPCVCISSFCLSFLFFNFVVFHASLPNVAPVLLLIFGVISLITVFVTGYIEKKLYRQFLDELNIKTQNAVKESRAEKHE